MFVTSQLFATSDQAFNTRMIGYVIILMTIIRVVEIAFDPMIGGAVDNTSTRWGKFKPWLLIGTLTASVMLALIFSSFGGLATNKPMLYLVLFGIAFLTYSFSDIALWSILPALSMDSKERTRFGTVSRFGSTLGCAKCHYYHCPSRDLNFWIFRSLRWPTKSNGVIRLCRNCWFASLSWCHRFGKKC